MRRTEEGIPGEGPESSAKALGQERAWRVRGTVRRPGELKQSEPVETKKGKVREGMRARDCVSGARFQHYLSP